LLREAARRPSTAPPQFGPEDQRSDLWALGCVLYEAATGRRPFVSTVLLGLVREITTQEPPLPSSVVSSLSPYIDTVIMRALAKDPEQRFTSAEEMALSLRYVREREPRTPAQAHVSPSQPVAPLVDGLAKTAPQVDLVKGVWFVTCRRYILERYGDVELHAMAARMRQENRAAIIEGLASTWYPEEAFGDALNAFMVEIAKGDPRAFSDAMEDCTVLGINTFFRILLRATSIPFVLRKIPVLSLQYRRNDWKCEVVADAHQATVHWTNCPYLADPNYRLFCAAMLRKTCEISSGKRPECSIASFTSSTIKIDLRY
jgi:hypothetical protein